LSGIDGFTKLMMHMNGVDESTSFIDSSDAPHILTASGDAQIDTSQSVFGGASGLFLGSSDWVIVPDHADWDFGTFDMAIDCRVRFSTLAGNQAIISRYTSSSSYFYWALEGNAIRFRDFGGSIDFSRTVASMGMVADTWYHLAITRSGSNFRLFLNGVQQGATYVQAAGFVARAVDLLVGSFPTYAYHLNANVDELRISVGDPRWITDFTPPTSEYTSSIVALSDNLEITDSISVTDTTKALSDNLEISDSIEVTDTSILESDNLEITDSISVTDTTIPLSDNLEITDSIVLTSTNTDANFAYKILSINPLIFVTNTSPLEIVKVNITDPITPTWEVKTVSGVNHAKDVCLNSDGDYMYIAAEAGQVIKVEVADLSNQTTIDLSDTDDVLTIEHNEANGITYAGTDNAVGELYLIDERDTFKLDSDFTCLAPNNFIMDSSFNIVSAFKMDSAFTALSYSYFKMGSDFKCLPKQTVPIVTVNDITPIDLQDCHIYIDDVELEDTDVVLSSGMITISVGEESNATFQLTRKHDQLDTTLEGVASEITNQNTVRITCNGATLFPYNNIGTGRISDLDCQYQKDTEFVVVTAYAEEATNKVNGVTMSLASGSRASLYDVLLQNPTISNPYVDPTNEDNPKKYKGIKVDLGTSIEQSVSFWHELDINGYIADRIQAGTFVPVPNWDYFWSPTATNIGDFANPEFRIGGKTGFGTTAAVRFFYIGSSLSPLSEDLWDLTKATHWRQRIFDDIESGNITLKTTLPGYITVEETVEPAQDPAGWKTGISWGQTPSFNANTWNEGYKTYKTYYYVGEAPFLEIKPRNGKKISKPKYKDKGSALYSVTDESYDYTQYAKDVADLEYEQLKNINGDILPDTSCVFGLTLDSYLYYDIGLLTRINVDNTTTANIYNKNKGFPVSAKSITISLSDRKVSIDADNTKSVAELEIINSAYPDEDADEYSQPEKSVYLFPKTNMKTRLNYETAQEEEQAGS